MFVLSAFVRYGCLSPLVSAVGWKNVGRGGGDEPSAQDGGGKCGLSARCIFSFGPAGSGLDCLVFLSCLVFLPCLALSCLFSSLVSCVPILATLISMPLSCLAGAAVSKYRRFG